MSVSRTPGYRVRKVGTLQDEGTNEVEAPTAPGEPERVEPEDQGVRTEVAGPSAEAEGASAAGPAPLSSGETASTSRRSRLRAAVREAPVLALVAVLGVAGTIGFGLAWGLGHGGGPQTSAVTTSARNLVIALTNFDPGTVKSDFKQIQADATGSFATQAKQFFGKSITSELSSADAASRGTVKYLYVQSVHGTHATVFAVVTQKYLNKDSSTPIDDTLRLVLGLTDVNGTWKTSSVRVLQQPVSASSGSS